MPRYILLIIVIVIIVVGALFFFRSGFLNTAEPGQENQPAPSVAEEKSASAPAGLTDRGWVWTETVSIDGSTVTPNGEKQFIVTFTPDGRVSAQTDCNTFMGDYTISGTDMITINANASTLMACMGDDIQQDEFIESLSRASTFTLTDNGLTLGLTDSSTMNFE